jgi:hypothetical protein
MAFADGKLSGRVTDHSGQPVGDASVIITSTDGVQSRTVTDPTGHYVTMARGAGPFSVMFAFGPTQVQARVDVPADGHATLDTQIEIGGEVIEIQGEHAPVVYPQPKGDPLVIPPYSDKAALRDAWTKAWLLLDVDDHGVVTRAKFLKRPGFDLDEVAVNHVFGLRFDPARDKRGIPTKSYVVWPLEWPSMTWMQSRGLLLNRLPVFPAVTQVAGGVFIDGYPPCAGSGGWTMDELHPMYRDCSVPNLSIGNAAEPWFVRDSRIPPPVVADAPVISPAQMRADRAAELEHNRTMAYVTTATTAALLAGSIYAYTQFTKYSDRVDHLGTASSQDTADRDRKTQWELGLVGLVAGTVISGITSASYWNHASLTVAPTGESAAVSFGGRF